MTPKRLAVVVIGLVAAAGLILAGVYYGTTLSHRAGPSYTKPAKLIEKWDGPGTPAVDTAPTPPTGG
jgi:hypothetical protein